jgi:hypothetical protein
LEIGLYAFVLLMNAFNFGPSFLTIALYSPDDSAGMFNPKFVTSQKLMVKRLNLPAESSGEFFQSGQLFEAV